MELALFVPCPLCGEVHELRIHALLWRNVRSPEQGENTEIVIVAIICGRAEEAGKQYTKRILPPFVIPYCQIGREGVMAYLHRFPEGRIVYRFGNELLGARDIRTIRRHIAMGLADDFPPPNGGGGLAHWTPREAPATQPARIFTLRSGGAAPPMIRRPS